ncbi:hypothetical protein [Zongyangia hominis]|uniref:Uncharacterized protein n=1 Tax=Zongyangia hominis TaxID=2763677 RepID=A0A926E9Q5_9FIRM|nr:hypothetical protein [Zongyangia hominis]MBC8569917.1 hypothetical protein [Zongyangia hominis]
MPIRIIGYEPEDIEDPKPDVVNVWYDDYVNKWTVQVIDEAGDQFGDLEFMVDEAAALQRKRALEGEIVLQRHVWEQKQMIYGGSFEEDE